VSWRLSEEAIVELDTGRLDSGAGLATQWQEAPGKPSFRHLRRQTKDEVWPGGWTGDASSSVLEADQMFPREAMKYTRR